MHEALWEEGDTPDSYPGALAAKAVGDVIASFKTDLDKMSAALRAGGSHAEMESLARAYRSHGEVVRLLTSIAIDLSKGKGE